MRAPLNIIGGFYKDPNKHWSAQDTLNWYPVRSERAGTRTEWEFRDAPGIKPLCKLGINDGTFVEAGPGRGLRNVEGKLFAVAGTQLFQITNDLVSVPYGTIPGVGRVSMAHNQYANGNELLTVNGSAGYVLNTATQTFQKITDTGYPGAFIADYVDGYLAQVEPLGRYWFHSDLADALAYSTLDQYEAEGDPDRIVTLHVSHREVLLFGADTIEPYVNAPRGSGIAPFQRASNTVIQCGCSAKFSPKTIAGVVAFLDDKRVVQVLSGYSLNRISTVGIEQALGECSREEIAAAYAYTFEDRGHKIYYLTVPGRFTFGYDFLAQEWHRRASFGLADLAFVDVAFWNGMWVALDRRYGRLYQLDWDYKLDVCDPLVRERVTGVLSNNQNRVTVNELELLFNVGTEISVCQPFQDQPEGPTITGEAPDGIVGDAYTYTYTVTPGDSPIARTVLRAGSAVIIDGTSYNLPAQGWVWNQATATISNTEAAPNTTVHLFLRTYDENGLYADHEDEFIGVAQHTLLVSGDAISGGEPVIAQLQTIGSFAFTGIPQSSGANVNGMCPAYFKDPDEVDGYWMLAGSTGYRYGTTVTSWTSGTMPFTGGQIPRRLAGGPAGWLASCINPGVPEFAQGASEAGPFTLGELQITRPINPPSLPDIHGLGFIRYVSGRYMIDPLELTGYLSESVDLGDEWLLLHGRGDSAPTNDDIGCFLDVCEYDGALYACVLKSVSATRYQLRRSNDGGVTWPDLLIDGNGTPPRPFQVEAGNGVLLVYCWGGEFVYTSADNFATPRPTGIRTTTVTDMSKEPRFRQIEYAGGYFYIISGASSDPDKANKCVRTIDGTDISAPISIPLNAVIGIATDQADMT